MEGLTHLLLHQWQRKLLALIIGLTVWILVNHSITSTATISSVPIRVMNLPIDKTIQGLLPNGFLSKRITLTLTGTKNVIEQLEPGDLELLIDVANQPNEGIIQITKKNLISLNPNINISNHVTSVTHPEFAIKMSLLITEKIPVTINPPIGSPPEGFEFLDIWPVKLTQTVSGPQDLIFNLKNNGLELTFNLNEITKEELDDLRSERDLPYDDEISYVVPDQWKMVVIPLVTNMIEPLNDPEAKNLQINFLRKEYIPLKEELPVNVFYPLKFSDKINPKTHALAPNNFIQLKNHIPILKLPLYAYNVSKLFVDIVKDHLQIDIVAAPKSERKILEWGVDFIDYSHLEDTYLAFSLSDIKTQQGSKVQNSREQYFRDRFRSYMQNFSLYLADQKPLEIVSSTEDSHIVIQVLNATTQTSSSDAR